jgi:formamidopyrimidine-DNA glycosylase
MPELPEVETVRTGLAEILPGKRIQQVEHNWEKSFPNAVPDVKKFLIGARISDVRRRAKVLLIDLETNYSLVIHLKMTGQLVYRGKDQDFGAGHPTASLIGVLPDKSTRVDITFTDESHLFFNDQRKFGWMRLIPTPEVDQLDFFLKVGPEPLSSDFTPEDFAKRLLRRSKSGIKAVLLDQTVIAGVGNIYADESLWSAKIHPLTKVQDIPMPKINELYKAIRDILTLSIEKGGSSARNYVDAKGKRGSYLEFANVFNRTGQPCRRCGTLIIKTKVAGRGTHICPICQKPPELS